MRQAVEDSRPKLLRLTRRLRTSFFVERTGSLESGSCECGDGVNDEWSQIDSTKHYRANRSRS